MRTRWLTAGLVTGCVLLAARLILPAVPFWSGHSFSEAHSLCSGALGAFISAFSHKAAQGCGEINTIWTAATVVAVLAFALAAGCGAALIVRRSRATAGS